MQRQSDAHRNGILHVSYGAIKLGEVKFRGVWQRKLKEDLSKLCIRTWVLPLGRQTLCLHTDKRFPNHHRSSAIRHDIVL